MKCLSVAQVSEMMAGTSSKEEKLQMNEHISSCLKCRALRDELVQMTARLKVNESAYHSPAEIHKIMTIIDVGKADTVSVPAIRTRKIWLMVPLAAMLLTAFTVGLFWSFSNKAMPQEMGFQARSDGIPNPDQWVSLKIFEHRGEKYRPAIAAISASSPLAFKYKDFSREPFPYLMIMAADETGQSFWYYPPYVTPNSNPKSIHTQSASGEFQLPDEVEHYYSPGQIRIFGIFSREPLDVQTVENVVKAQVERHGNLKRMRRLRLPGTAQYSQLLKVEKNID